MIKAEKIQSSYFLLFRKYQIELVSKILTLISDHSDQCGALGNEAVRSVVTLEPGNGGWMRIKQCTMLVGEILLLHTDNAVL